MDLATANSVIVVSAPSGNIHIEKEKQCDSDKPYTYLSNLFLFCFFNLDVKNACWGGLMSAGAKARQVQGAVIDGRVRDLAEHRSMGFPVSYIGRDHRRLKK